MCVDRTLKRFTERRGACKTPEPVTFTYQTKLYGDVNVTETGNRDSDLLAFWTLSVARD
jgi:hypothetical protein